MSHLDLFFKKLSYIHELLYSFLRWNFTAGVEAIWNINTNTTTSRMKCLPNKAKQLTGTDRIEQVWPDQH